MAIKGVALTVTYTAWDTSNQTGKTGDVANHTIRLIRDGAAQATPTNTPTESGATNGPGEYNLVLTAAEMTVDFIAICGKSSTAGVIIVPVKITTEHGVLPTAVSNATGGIATNVVRGGTAQAGNGNSITLDASASATNDLYKGLVVNIISGTGAGQARTIITYGGANKVATVDRPWATNPNNTSVFVLLPANAPALTASLFVTAAVSKVLIFSGTAQTGSTSNTIKLSAAASPTNGIYNNDLVSITGGTGVGQTRTIVSYNGATKVATVDKNWNTTPDNTSTFEIYASTSATTFSDQGVLQAATASTATLAATASAVNNIYNGSLLTILSGTDGGDTAEITAYNGTTKVATISGTFAVTPDTTSSYAVLPTDSGSGVVSTQNVNVQQWAGTAVGANIAGVPKVDTVAWAGDAAGIAVDANHLPKMDLEALGGSLPALALLKLVYSVFENGTAQGGGASTITLRAGAVASDNYYKDQVIFITGGTGQGQTNRISSYVGSTRVATVETAWVTQPDGTSVYIALGRVG